MSDRCRSCGAAIEWAVTVKGRRVPLDVERGDKPNIVIDPDGRARVVAIGEGDRTAHFATCPHAAKHRHRPARVE